MIQNYRCTGRRLLAGAVFALSSSAALADAITLDFDDLSPTFFGAGDSFAYRGLELSAQGGPDIEPGNLVGAIFDGTDPSMCQRLYCPIDNYSPGYYAGLNDGVLVIEAPQGGLHIKSFDASFIGSFERMGYIDYYPEVAGQLEIRGYTASGNYVSEFFNLSGPQGQDFVMQHYDTSSAFASQAFTSFSIFAYSCNFAGECSAFENNAGQFALDNMNMEISAVPEPTTWLMLLAGLGTVAALRRRSA